MFKKLFVMLVMSGLSAFAMAVEPVAPDLLDRIATYTKQFVQAAMPVAKQAYEIGLVTLRIDAAASLLYGCIAAGICYICARLAMFFFKDNDDQEPVAVVLSVIAVGAGLCALFTLLDVWMWVKLFHPDLWLAHMAIEKLVH